MVDLRSHSIDTARSLMIGLAAGGAAYHFINQSTFVVVGFLLPAYLILVAFSYAIERVLQRFAPADGGAAQPWADADYAS